MDENVQVSAVFPDPPHLPMLPTPLRLVSLPLVKMTSLKMNYQIVASVFITEVTLNRQIPCFRKMLEHCSDF